MSLERIAESFARQGMMRTLDARIDAVAPGLVSLSAPITASVGQQHGYGHAALAFAVGDSAAGYAALSVMEPGREVLTVEMKINLVAPAAGLRLHAHGEVVKPGRRLVVVRARVEAEDAEGARRDVALLQGTMIPVGDPA
ncbi:hotdog fold thioesterase [Rhodobacterales bacterium HKCCE2091]|nr:hotdog fold thioesterase [Rhodobacterales bacterium HKCCE2091]